MQQPQGAAPLGRVLSPHATASHLTLGEPPGRGPPHTWPLATRPRSPGARTSEGSAREAQAIFYTRHPMFTLSSLLLIFDVILQQDFCTKTVMVLGWGEEREHIFC